MRRFPGLSRTLLREDFSWRKIVSSAAGSPLHEFSPILLCPRNAWEWVQLGWRQADINSLTCERKVSLIHTSDFIRCANNKQQQVSSPGDTLEMGFGCSEERGRKQEGCCYPRARGSCGEMMHHYHRAHCWLAPSQAPGHTATSTQGALQHN